MPIILQKRIASDTGKLLILALPLNYLNLDRLNQLLVKVNKPCSIVPYTQMPWLLAKAEMERLNR